MGDGAVFNRDESRILTWSGDGTARLWAVGQNEAIQTFKHEKWVRGAVFNRDESRILTWSSDPTGSSLTGTTSLWAVGQSEPIQTFKDETSVNGAVFNRDESRILTWGFGTVRVWDIALDEKIPLDERILDFQVRSATSLDGSIELRLLSFDAWMARKRELEAMRTKRKSPK